MKLWIKLAVCTCLGAITPVSPASAQVMPWRDGDSRQVGWGHCSKGPCMKRTCWAPSRPHRHESGRIVIDRYGGPECWARDQYEPIRRRH